MGPNPAWRIVRRSHKNTTQVAGMYPASSTSPSAGSAPSSTKVLARAIRPTVEPPTRQEALRPLGHSPASRRAVEALPPRRPDSALPGISPRPSPHRSSVQVGRTRPRRDGAPDPPRRSWWSRPRKRRARSTSRCSRSCCGVHKPSDCGGPRARPGSAPGRSRTCSSRKCAHTQNGGGPGALRPRNGGGRRAVKGGAPNRSEAARRLLMAQRPKGARQPDLER